MRQQRKKPGNKPPDKTEYAIAYERDGLPNGITVAEWERAFSLPRWTVYPHLRESSPNEKGFYMYVSQADLARGLR